MDGLGGFRSQQHDNYMQLFEYMNGREDWNIAVRFGTFTDYFRALKSRLMVRP